MKDKNQKKPEKKEKQPAKKRDDQKHVMTEEEKLDETIDESFPASDPPGHYSVSHQDGKEYRE